MGLDESPVVMNGQGRKKKVIRYTKKEVKKKEGGKRRKTEGKGQ